MYKILLLFLAMILANTYTTSTAHDMAFMSDIAYAPLNQIDTWSCSLCSNYGVKAQKAFFFSGSDIQGFAAYLNKQNAIVVSFRGTTDFINWIYNLETIMVPYPGCPDCYVHKGFYYDYQGVAPFVKHQVARLMELFRGAKLILTGHSLGGAMSILCALELKKIYGKVDQIYNFGQPRVGNQNLANYLQSQFPNYYRVINYADVVSHIPPMAFGFCHGGHQQWYNPRGMQSFRQCAPQDDGCSNSISTIFLSTDDHHIAYYEKLKVVSGIFQKIQSLNLRKQPSIYTKQQIIQAQARKVQLIKQVIGEQLNKN